MKKVTNITELILKSSLYESIEITSENFNSNFRFLTSLSETQFDCYCISCAKDTTFRLVHSDFNEHKLMSYVNLSSTDKVDIVVSDATPKRLNFACQRNPEHLFTILLKAIDTDLVKIGQYPSLADIEKHDIEKYKKLLKKDYVNLNKAIGLRTHGIGAGSYVYLRRIFENLIEEKHLEAQTEHGWDEDKYNRSKMKEKIKLLEHKLPSILLETPELYGILSKGIHELSEEQCLEYFPVTKFAIELILDEKLVMLEKEAKMKDLKSSLGSIAATISK
ncbi:hypothetical protein [Lysinibacillus sp. NPDC093688]|uniref:hypothetical protein n=1 Tax=Lysinibacillus sp. NPDC093688 TaxID=3390577 RepID=UPI003CFF67C8